MSQYITLEKSDPKFRSYLLGSFSSSQVALPVESLHVDTARERVTFQILDRQEIQRPGLLRILFSLFRFEMLPLTLFPVAVVLLDPARLIFWPSSGVMLFMFTSLICLHATVFALNDYVDHIKGLDRLSDRAGSRIIQQGFFTAREVLLLSFFVFGLAVMAAVPVLVQNPLLFLFGFLGIALGAFGYSYARTGMQRLVVGGASVFVAFGPLLVFGTALFLNTQLTLLQWQELTFLSALFGGSTVIYLHVRQLSTLMVDHLAGIKTLAVKLGFDRAKNWIVVQQVLLQSLFLYYWFVWNHEDRPGMWIPAAAVSATALWYAYRVWRVSSPLSSQIRPLALQHIQMHGWMGGALILGQFL